MLRTIMHSVGYFYWVVGFLVLKYESLQNYSSNMDTVTTKFLVVNITLFQFVLK